MCIRDRAHQIALAVRVKVVQRQRLQMCEQVAADVLQNLLRGTEDVYKRQEVHYAKTNAPTKNPPRDGPVHSQTDRYDPAGHGHPVVRHP